MRTILFISFFILSLLSQCHSIADRCTTTNCQLSNGCRCSSASSPLSNDTIPQFISITVNEGITELAFNTYWDPLFTSRTNPDGAPVRLTFFVPHEFTDYTKVNQLYLYGHEIAVGTVTFDYRQEYWRNATLDTLINEFQGQKEILHNLANIPLEDIVGARTPALQLQGDVSIAAYEAADLIYDNSWPTLNTAPLFPYTLDYLSTQSCDTSASGICPGESHEGFWILPIIDLIRADGIECNTITSCINATSPAGTITSYLIEQVQSIRNGPRTPLTLSLSSSFFNSQGSNALQAFQDFLDQLEALSDVYLVSQTDVIDWIRSPVGLEQYRTPSSDRNANCNSLRCSLEFCERDTRIDMRACNSCPEVFPWIGNPNGERDQACQ